MEKIYVSANELNADAFKLAEKIQASGFNPNLVVGLLRGGAPISIAIHEYFKYINSPAKHTAIHCSSYRGIATQDSKVTVDGLDFLTQQISLNDRILLVDDIFDSGRSLNTVLEMIDARIDTNMNVEIRLATLWYKPSMNRTNITPSYHLHKTDKWIVFPHELDGLSQMEITHFKPDIASLILTGNSASEKH